jgi:hypothetical protein
MANLSKSLSAAEAARTRAWVVTLLALAGDAFSLGEVRSGSRPSMPAVTLSSEDGALLVLADVLEDYSAAARAQRRARRARLAPLEYWQVSTTGRAVWLYQRGADGALHATPPDSAGTHYTLFHEDVRFPVVWFAGRPTLLEMMSAWGLVELE